MTVTFETKCWENDWEPILKTNHLRNLINRNNFKFKERVLFINNVHDYDLVAKHAQALVDSGILTKFYIVKDYAKEALDFFEITKQSLGNGYVYSIAELVSIYLCKTPYLLHFSGDTYIPKKVNWIPEAISLFKKHKDIKVINLLWDNDHYHAQQESTKITSKYYFGQGFSDQMYFVRTKDVRAKIFNEHHPLSQRYPPYGGELFEKRMDAWMRANNFKRVTFKNIIYEDKKMPRNAFEKKLRMKLGYYN